MNLIVTGEVGSGKSSHCQRYARHLQECGFKTGGVICRPVFQGGIKVGYSAVDIRTSAEAVFSLTDPQADFQGEKVGKYSILQSGLAFACNTIREALKTGCEVIFLDEIGHLEIAGKGLSEQARLAYQKAPHTISVVRKSLLPKFLTAFAPEESSNIFIIHDIDTDADIHPAFFKNKPDQADISCIILAGGKSTRLGSNKVTATLNSQTLLERAVSNLSGYGREILVVTAYGQADEKIKPPPGVRIIQDILPGKGPLAGIYSGLTASKSPFNMVIACDMPFINRPLLEYMKDQITGFEAVVPRLGQKPEPLHAIYSKSAGEKALRLIKEGKSAVSDLLACLKTRYIEEDEINGFDPEHRSFFNINRPEDLEKARNIADT
ncbi:NTP transferase domain-containing protein [Dehalococcoides mccartyi]|uniref:NTP transferase domain-containing protein n=1 Tax=Dehalococcoides mccartyi TaxID=61435 RepID=UPI0003C8A41F|nr:NTP transferase domain-containing protein [Dehalococcoides mccartyi]AHB12915.1 molybdopterin-guanine dinucleotide biosynthesis protein A [Dehalococcoides mccartyi GY50]AII57330.1 molybdopterin-guanine dinucleotide biosynthesis protein MobA [Dehalococcoides mccartyi CG1]APH11826.1 molybdopterin-guanine dinucleotide biosynthesis protein MobA [Dehalococcoides mccartyi]